MIKFNSVKIAFKKKVKGVKVKGVKVKQKKEEVIKVPKKEV